MLLPTVKEFKKTNNYSDYQLQQYLSELFARNGMLPIERLNFIYKYLDDDRDIWVVDKPNGLSRVYLSTCEGDPTACYMDFKEGYFQVQEVRYDRKGNGNIQSGTVVFRKYTIANWPHTPEAMAVRVTDIGKPQARVTLIKGPDGAAVVKVVTNADPKTLSTAIGPGNIFDEIGGPLTLLKKIHIKGSNNINGALVKCDDEDNHCLQEFNYAMEYRF